MSVAIVTAISAGVQTASAGVVAVVGLALGAVVVVRRTVVGGAVDRVEGGVEVTGTGTVLVVGGTVDDVVIVVGSGTAGAYAAV